MAGGVRRSPVVVGRRLEQERVRGAVEAAGRGTGGCVFLTGEGGIGKSRLLGEAVLAARRRGLAALVGRASIGVPTSFGVVAEALRSWLRAQPHDVPPRFPTPTVYDPGLRLILPEWPADLGAGAAGLTGSQLRLLALEGVVELCRTVAAPAGLLLAVDDLHAADPESLETLRYLVASASAGVLVLAASRVGESSMADQLIGSLVQQGLAERWPLDPLPREDVDDLLAALIGTRPPPELVADVVARTDGVPLLVEEIVDAHVRAGSVAIDGRGARWRGGVNVVPRAVVDVVASRLAQLSDPERDVITAGSVVGLAEADLLCVTAGQPLPVVRSAIAAAVDAGLVERVGGAVQFRHAVVGEAVREHALADVIRSVHARAAAALADRAPGDSSLSERRAGHLAAIGRGEEAAAALVEASAAELARPAPLQAEALARQAVDLTSLDSRAGAEAADALGAALSAQGRWADALAVDGATARRHGFTTERWVRMARCALDGRLLDAARVLAAEAVTLGDHSPFVDVTVGRLALYEGDGASALAAADGALDAAPPSDAATRCAALDLRGRALDFLGRRSEAAAAWAEQAEVGAAAGLTAEHLRGVVSLAELELLDGQPLRRMFEAVELARASGALVEEAWAGLNLALALALQGDPRAALPVAEATVALCRRHRLDLLPFALMMRLAPAVYLEEPGFDELLAEARRLGGDAADVIVHTSGAAGERALHDGRYEEALAHFDAITEVVRAEPGSVPADSPFWRPILLMALGRDGEAAEALEEAHALPADDRWHGRRVVVAAAEALVGRDGPALDAALASAPGRMPFSLAVLRVLAAEIVGGEARPRWFREALDIYESCGVTIGVDRVRRLLRDSGGAVPRRRRTSLVPADLIPLGVTAREAEVLGLVEAGLSNAAIAGRLFLSVRTVESHVSSLLAKLGVENRAALSTPG